MSEQSDPQQRQAVTERTAAEAHRHTMSEQSLSQAQQQRTERAAAEALRTLG
jgi:hypothetical protein